MTIACSSYQFVRHSFKMKLHWTLYLQQSWYSPVSGRCVSLGLFWSSLLSHWSVCLSLWLCSLHPHCRWWSVKLGRRIHLPILVFLFQMASVILVPLTWHVHSYKILLKIFKLFSLRFGLELNESCSSVWEKLTSWFCLNLGVHEYSLSICLVFLFVWSVLCNDHPSYT